MRQERSRRLVCLALGVAMLATLGAGAAAAQVYPPGGCSLALSTAVAVQGETVQASTGGSDGFAAGATVSITVQSTGQVLATATADASGHISVPITIPPGMAPGSYVLAATGQGSAGATATCTATLTVASVAGESAAGAAPAGSGPGSAVGSGGALAFTGSDPRWWIALALVLLTVGSALVLGARRRAALRAQA